MNSRPHLGHAYEKLAADVITRYQRQHGKDVLLQVGVDEHSTNVVRKANELGLAPKVYCDQMVAIYEEFFAALQIDYSRLIRTSDADHLAVVQEILIKVAKKGYIYAGKYEGWYCPSCEAFYRERDLVDGKCPVHDFLAPQWISEYNYYFRLSAFQDAIRQHLETNPQWVEPESRRNDILRRLEDGLEDISISRAVSDWGVPIPAEVNDYIDSETLGLTREELAERLANHKVYVWFDALLNYVTGAGYGTPEFETIWPANLQLIGKDINWFHAVIQSAILLALDLPLPEKIYAHGFITKDGRRISSSLGNLIYPSEVIEKFGLDPLRYYLFRRVSFGQDGDFSWKEFTECYNTSLANILGNLVYRSLKMTEKYFGGVIPKPNENEPVDDALYADREATCREVTELLERLELSQGLVRIEEFIRRCNRYIDETTPWAIKDEGRLATVIYNLLDAIYLGARLLQPFVPGTAEEIFRRLGQNENLTNLVLSGGKANENDPSQVATYIARDQLHQTNKVHGNLQHTDNLQYHEDVCRSAGATTTYRQLRLQSGVTVESGQPLYPRFEDK